MGILTNWVPFRMACWLPYLRKGTLNVGNTQQNRLNFATLAIAQANSPSNPVWAKWRVGFHSTTSTAGLLINPRLCPYYVAPPNTGYQNGTPSDIVTLTNGSSVEPMTSAALNSVNINQSDGCAGWCITALAAANLFGSISASPKLPSGAVIDGIVYDEATNLLAVIAAGTLAQTYFTSLSFTNRVPALVTYNTASAAGFASGIGSGAYTCWTWSVASLPWSPTGGVYPITFT
jgi:hypothetical protein